MPDESRESYLERAERWRRIAQEWPDQGDAVVAALLGLATEYEAKAAAMSAEAARPSDATKDETKR